MRVTHANMMVDEDFARIGLVTDEQIIDHFGGGHLSYESNTQESMITSSLDRRRFTLFRDFKRSGTLNEDD